MILCMYVHIAAWGIARINYPKRIGYNININIIYFTINIDTKSYHLWYTAVQKPVFEYVSMARWY